MFEYFVHNIIEPTLVINTKRQAIEIPQKFHQILNYDKIGECYELAANRRYLSGGLNAGIFTDSRVFYKYVPEVETIPKLNLNQPERRKRTEIHFNKDIFAAKETHDFVIGEVGAKNVNTPSCRLMGDSDSSYTVR